MGNKYNIAVSIYNFFIVYKNTAYINIFILHKKTFPFHSTLHNIPKLSLFIYIIQVYFSKKGAISILFLYTIHLLYDIIITYRKR